MNCTTYLAVWRNVSPNLKLEPAWLLARSVLKLELAWLLLALAAAAPAAEAEPNPAATNSRDAVIDAVTNRRYWAFIRVTLGGKT